MIRASPESFGALLPRVRALRINDLFARSVLERCVEGRVWVDRVENPRLCHIAHPYGMTLLLGSGEPIDPEVLRLHLDELRNGNGPLWIQVIGDELVSAFELRRAAGARLERYTRANFRFDAALHDLRRRSPPEPAAMRSRRLGRDDFARTDVSVSPRMFWRDADQFFANGGGWCVDVDGSLGAMAFASFNLDGQLEIGVETLAAHRRKGLGYHAALAMVRHCLAHGLEPVWSCRKENAASYELAKALGFVPTLELPYYRLDPVQNAAP